MSSPAVPRAAAFWRRVPFRHMTVLVLLLYVVKEQFPFSNFPMYSRIDEEADIVYATDQADQALPMDKVFRTGSGTAKKMYKSRLTALRKAEGGKLEDAAPQDRAAAGKEVLEEILGRVRSRRMPEQVTHVRLYRKTFRMEEEGIAHLEPELLAELPVTPAAP